MGEPVSFRLPEETDRMLEELSKEEVKDKSEIVRELLAIGIKEKKIQRAIKLYLDGKVTMWKAARVAGLSLWQMIEVMRERKIEAQYGLRELEEDLKALKE